MATELRGLGQREMSPITTSLPKDKARRIERILAEAVERYEHELLLDEERMLLLDRIRFVVEQQSTGHSSIRPGLTLLLSKGPGILIGSSAEALAPIVL